jgi:hypothetical protein
VVEQTRRHIGKVEKCFKKLRQKFPLTPMGVLAPWSAHVRPSARPPIDMSGNFCERLKE